MLAQLDAEKVVSILVAGLLSGIITLISCVSFATLIFTGEMAPHLSLGITMLVATAAVGGSLISLFSGYRPMVAMPDDDTAPILALMVSLVIATLPVDVPPTVLLYTALGALTLTALLTGLTLAALGGFRMGYLVRYLPYSVMGGYFAGAGLLLIQGSLRVVTDLPLDGALEFIGLLDREVLLLWLPAATVAMLLRLASTRLPQSFGIPCTVLLSALLFYAACWALGLGGDAMMSRGLLLGPFPETASSLWNPLLLEHSADIYWPGIFNNLSSIATIALISAVSLMFTASNLALLQRDTADINRELTVAGAASAFSGLGGGVVALPSMSVTRLAMTLGAPASPLVGLTVGLFCAVSLLYGMHLIAWFPKPVLAGLLMFLGWSFVEHWLIAARKQLPSLEYLVVLIIVSVVAAAGFLQGVVVGLLCAIVLFVVNYSRIKVVRHSLTGSQRRSNVERNSTQSAYLQERGDQTLILKLQGYLFFGTAAELLGQVDRRLQDREQAALRFVVFDFSQVSEMDSSAALSFMRLAQEAVKSDFQLLLTGLTPAMHERLLANWFEDDTDSYVHVFEDLDRGLEWCEEETLLEQSDSAGLAGVLDQLSSFLPDEGDRSTLFGFLESRAVNPGDVLATQGEPTEEMFLLDDCTASVYLETESSKMNRIRRAGAGTVFGEVGFFLDTPRSATVIVDNAGQLYVLHRSAHQRLEQEHPHIAAALHKFMISVITRRLLLTTTTLRAVLT